MNEAAIVTEQSVPRGEGGGEAGGRQAGRRLNSKRNISRGVCENTVRQLTGH